MEIRIKAIIAKRKKTPDLLINSVGS